MKRLPLIIGLVFSLYGLACIGSVIGSEAFLWKSWHITFLHDPGLWLIYQLIELDTPLHFLDSSHPQLRLFSLAALVVIAIGSGLWAMTHVIVSQILRRKQNATSLQEADDER